jgi:hypothetical protein
MSRRIDIELTSDRGDGTWTWRAAGAKQPKGVVDASLLPAGAVQGQQLRADIETTLDGTEVLAVLPPKEKNRAAVETIELLPRGGDEPLVTQTLAGRRGGDRGDRRDRGPRGDREGGRGRDGDRRPRGDRERGPRGDRPGGDRPSGDRGRSDRDRGDRRERGPGGDRGDRGPRGPRSDRPRRERPAPPPKPKAKRLRPGRVHRKAALDLLSSEEQVIGEQLLAGGIPGLRQAIEKQNEQAKAEGTRAVSAAPLLVIAERLWPALRAADWRDRAEAALADLDELDLRDLRSVVVAADGAAKDDESLALAGQLRDGLTARLDHEHQAWLTELADNLREGRVVRALRLSSRPPKAGAPLPAELATQLADATAAALTADTVADRWATVLDALSFSPVRLTVVPASKPDEPSAELVAVVTRMAGRVPKVAEAFGIDPSSVPDRRARGNRGGPAGGGRPPKRGSGGPGGQKGKAVPPPPPPPPAPAAETEAPAAAEAAGPDVPVADAPATETEAPATTGAPADAPEAPATGAPSPEVEGAATAEATDASAPADTVSEVESAASGDGPADVARDSPDEPPAST